MPFTTDEQIRELTDIAKHLDPERLDQLIAEAERLLNTTSSSSAP